MIYFAAAKSSPSHPPSQDILVLMARVQICLRRIHGTQPCRPGTRPQRKRLQGPQHQGDAEAHQRARHGPWPRSRRLPRRQRRVRPRRRVPSPGRLQRWWSRPRSGLRALLGARRWHARILGRVIREKSVEERCKPRKLGMHVRFLACAYAKGQRACLELRDGVRL